MANNRLNYLDAVKLLAISSVIYGHCIQHYMGLSMQSLPYMLIYSVHMPLFMLISGFFSRNSLELNFKEFCRKKCKQLLQPYVSWQLISIAIKLLIGSFSIEECVRYDFWFLISLFICSMLTWVYAHLNGYWKNIYLFGTILLLQFGIFRLRDMYPCFLVGYFISCRRDFFEKNNRGFLVVSVTLYALLAYFTLDQNFFDVGYSIKGMLKHINVLAVGIAGSIAVISLFHSFRSKIPLVICNVGQKTLTIYLVQSLLFTITKNSFHIDEYNLVLTYLCTIPLITLLYTTIAVLIEKTIKRSKNLSLIMLGK